MASENIQQKVLFSFFYSVIGKYINIIITLIITSILARLISPVEYGVVAVINVFLVFFNNIAEMGLGASIIQKKRIKKVFVDSLFSFTLFIGIILSIIFILFSKYFLVGYYQNIVYAKLGVYVATNILISTLLIVPKSLLLRWRRFKIQGIQLVISNTISGIISIIMAYFNFSYYAIIFQGILMNGILLVIICVNLKYKPDILYPLKYIDEVFSYSSFVFSSNILNYFGRNLDKILIGKYLGIEILGYYDRGYRLMIFPLSIFPYILNNILHPIFARYQNNSKKIYEEYLKILKELLKLGVFISIFTFFSAKEIVYILYGEHWNETISILKILSISIVIQIIASTTGGIYLALGRSKEMFLYSSIYSFILIITTIFGIYMKSILLLCSYLTIGFFIGGYFLYKGLLKLFKQSFFIFIKEFKETYLFCICLIVINLLYRKLFYLDSLYLNFMAKLLLNFFLFLLFNIKKVYLLYKIFINKFRLKEHSCIIKK